MSRGLDRRGFFGVVFGGFVAVALPKRKPPIGQQLGRVVYDHEIGYWWLDNTPGTTKIYLPGGGHAYATVVKLDVKTGADYPEDASWEFLDDGDNEWLDSRSR